MTSAVRTTERLRASKGFTLLEIVMVLAIAAMVMAGAVGLMIYSSDERSLRDVSGRIELLAKQARTVAILQQTPYAIEFRQNVIRMLPLALAGVEERRGRDSGLPQVDEDRQIFLNEDMRVSVRRWNSDAWLATGKTTVHVWRFDPDGLCEPISTRLMLNKSWLEDTYHPLTASIADTQSEIR